jgi:hypothetical protein
VRGIYRIVRPIGAGGMGVVFLAIHEGLRREVALKLHRAGHGSVGRARTMREAQAMARLAHPNVVVVHDVGEVDDGVFIAMEYVEGTTAKAVTTSAGTPWEVVLRTFVAAGKGLAAAHDVGLVHRDFKPDNVLVGRDGRVRVADFGIARAAWETLEPERSSAAMRIVDVSLTATGALVGTPAYMAPEQYGSSPVDARADQYAFCVALWEALHGQRPFAGATPAEIYVAIREQRFDRLSSTSVPGWVQRALERGLSFDPRDRWPSMHALLDVLEHGPARRRRVFVAMVTVPLALALVATLVGAAMRHTAQGFIDRGALATLESTSLEAAERAGAASMRTWVRARDEAIREQGPVVWPAASGLLGGSGSGMGSRWPGGTSEREAPSPPSAAAADVAVADAASSTPAAGEAPAAEVAAAGSAPEPPFADGQYSCGLSARYELRGKTIQLAAGSEEEEALWVGGDCELRVVDCTIVAPTGLWIGGRARVTIEGGVIEGGEYGIYAGGDAHVDVVRTELRAAGGAKRAGAAASYGVYVAGNASATFTDVTVDADIAADVRGEGSLELRRGELVGRTTALSAWTSPGKLVVDGTRLDGAVDVDAALLSALR